MIFRTIATAPMPNAKTVYDSYAITLMVGQNIVELEGISGCIMGYAAHKGVLRHRVYEFQNERRFPYAFARYESGELVGNVTGIVVKPN